MLITGRNNIDSLRIITLRSALKLEMLGMKRKGKSVYSIVKAEFGFKGNKQKVLDQLTNLIKQEGKYNENK